MKLYNNNHLQEVEETYWQHFRFGIWASMVFLMLFVVGTIHAVFPFLLSRYPDKIFNYFCQSSAQRLTRVKKILQSKHLE